MGFAPAAAKCGRRGGASWRLQVAVSFATEKRVPVVAAIDPGSSVFALEPGIRIRSWPWPGATGIRASTEAEGRVVGYDYSWELPVEPPQDE